MQKKPLLAPPKIGYSIENTRYSAKRHKLHIPNIKITDSFMSDMRPHEMSSIDAFTPQPSQPVSEDNRQAQGIIRFASTPAQKRISKKVVFYEGMESSMRYGSDINTSKDSGLRSTKRSNDLILYNKAKFREKMRNTALSFSNMSEQNQSTVDQTMRTITPTDRDLPVRMKRKSLKMANQELLALEQKNPHEPPIFKRTHVNSVVEKIKSTMNQKDNIVVDDIYRALKNFSKDKKKYMFSLGLVTKAYIEENPPYIDLYGGYVRDTVTNLALELKETLIKRDVYHMLLKQIEKEEPPARPLLLNPNFDLEDFLRERKMSSVTKYLKKEEDYIWKNAIAVDNETRAKFIKSGGDKEVEEILDCLTRPRTKAEQKSIDDSIFLTDNVLPASLKKTKYAEGLAKGYKNREGRKLIQGTNNVLDSMRAKIQNIHVKTNI